MRAKQTQHFNQVDMGHLGISDVGESSAYLLAAAKWDIGNGMFVNKFVERHRLPALALVTRGQHLSIGVPNVASPHLKPYVLVHSVQTIKKCYSTLVRMGKRKVVTSTHFSIPASLPGYWEILSADGRPVKCVQSVIELIAKAPEMVLVRQSCKAYQPDEDGELRNLYKSRSVNAGEVLTLVGQFHLKKIVFLRCFDERGSSVYLKLSLNGRFSPLAADDSITGVHTMSQLLGKPLPITVRQLDTPQERLPSELTKHASHGLPIVLQLNRVHEEKSVVIYSLQKESSRENGNVLTVPLSSHMQLSAAGNGSATRRTPAFQALTQRCDMLLKPMLNDVTLVDENAMMQDHGRHRNSSTDANTLSSGGDSLDSQDDFNVNDNVNLSPSTIDDEEIDQLYDYVRGLAPIPKSCKPRTSHAQHHSRLPRQPRVPNSISPIDTGESSSTSPQQQARYLSPAPRPHSRVFEINHRPVPQRRARPMSMVVNDAAHPMYHMAAYQQPFMDNHQYAAAFGAAHAGAPPLSHQRQYQSTHNMYEPFVDNSSATMRTKHSGTSRISGGQDHQPHKVPPQPQQPPPQFIPQLRHNFAHYPHANAMFHPAARTPAYMPHQHHMSHQNLSTYQQQQQHSRYNGMFVPQLAPFRM